MLEEYQKKVLKTYQLKKESNKLTPHLTNPTAANIRKECALVFHKRPDDHIKSILQSFGPIGFNVVIAEDILNIDPDKFRPLLNFINEDVAKASSHNVKLLAWLIDFDQNDKATVVIKDPNSSTIKQTLANLMENKVAVISCLIVIILATVGFIYIDNHQCMYWKGDHYEAIGCKIKVDTASVIALDQQKLDHLKKITRLDTIGEKDLDKVWYVKIKVDSAEFYTDSGEYPLDTRKRLLPMTPYILNKYILKKSGSN